MKVRQRETNEKEERCAVCHDSSGGLLLCRGCNTCVHASCLLEVRGCPTLGCGELDPLVQQQDSCQHHTFNAVDDSCYDCGASYKQIQRAEQEMLRSAADCNHRFNPMDYRCEFCGVGEELLWREGSLPRETWGRDEQWSVKSKDFSYSSFSSQFDLIDETDDKRRKIVSINAEVERRQRTSTERVNLGWEEIGSMAFLGILALFFLWGLVT